jgi:hypothetical protein
MERLNTIERYQQLADKLLNDPRDHVNLPICMNVGRTTTIKNNDGQYLALHPASTQTFAIQHLKTGKYIGCESVKKEKIRFDENRNKVPTGLFMLENQLTGKDTIQEAVLFDLDIKNKTTLLEFNNSNKIIRTGGSRKEITEGYSPDKNFFGAHMIAKYFQGGYKTELVNLIEQDDGSYIIQSNTHPGYYLSCMVNKKTGKINTRYDRTSDPHKYILHPNKNNNSVVAIEIDRCKDNVMNDGTVYRVVGTGEIISKPREYYWMVDYYIWEIIDHGNHVNIKLVADNREPAYLNICSGSICITDTPGQWLVENRSLKHKGTGVYLNIKDTITTSSGPVDLQFDL